MNDKKKEDSQEVNLALYDKTGALLMIDKMERRLLKELLTISLKSPSSRDWIGKKLGKEYIDVAEKLLKTLGGIRTGMP
jgi:hypothetical protein